MPCNTRLPTSVSVHFTAITSLTLSAQSKILPRNSTFCREIHAVFRKMHFHTYKGISAIRKCVD